MPLINGMKMACEPCIRGHRSTKCTHANERLMVPVRKPGRPLSACPHPRENSCGCAGVTAAIPRKQTCRCGGGAGATPAPSTTAPQIVPRSTNTLSNPDISSPTKASFKVQKSSRPPSRKQSFDPSHLERMSMNQVNIVSYDQRPQNVSVSMSNGYTAPLAQAYGYTPQYANIQPQYGHVPMQPPPNGNSINGHVIQSVGTNGYSNGVHAYNGLEHVVESPLPTEVTFSSGDSGKFINGGSYSPSGSSNSNGASTTEDLSQISSCCAPREKSHSQRSSSSSILEMQESKPGGCCSSKPSQNIIKTERALNDGGSSHSAPQLPPQMLSQNGMSFESGLYSPYEPQTTIFSYPSTYGSFQNPLQPATWRESLRANNLSQPQVTLPAGALPFDTQVIPATLDTTHTCTCGDMCQCIGCAAHPYNDATQEYVRSAWSSMSLDHRQNELYNANQPLMNGSNGNIVLPPQTTDHVTSPTAQTPSSTTSGNGEEQSLSEADFFFVNYPFAGDSCGGDTQSCPCGDDCECLGCTIHRPPVMTCGGEKDSCLCRSDCHCIGCEIHKHETKHIIVGSQNSF